MNEMLICPCSDIIHNVNTISELQWHFMLGMFDAHYTAVARGIKITGQTVVWLVLQNMNIFFLICVKLLVHLNLDMLGHDWNLSGRKIFVKPLN